MSDPGDHSPMANLAAVQARMDSLSRLLSESISLDAPIYNPTLAHFASSEIAAAVNQIVLSGTALISTSHLNHGQEIAAAAASDDFSIVEIDAAELVSERVHVCEICGKAFRRDANLRMHMRAHGDRFKTAEALAKPPIPGPDRRAAAEVRFSCPSPGCNRNKAHRKFRPLKSAVCARNHFRRSHCLKIYSCDRCQAKRFSVLADLRSHLKTCSVAAAEARWRCSCGAAFSQKEDLFGHVAAALDSAHVPEEENVPSVKGETGIDMEEEEEEEEEEEKEGDANCEEDDMFEGLLDGFGSVDHRLFMPDVLGI